MSILDLFKDDDFRTTYESIESKYMVDELHPFPNLARVDVVFHLARFLRKEDIEFILSLPLVVDYLVGVSNASRLLTVSLRLDYSSK